MILPKFQKRKGISPLIATLLLIAIAVAASVLTYSWVMSMIGSQSGQAQTQVRIDSVAYTYSNTAVVAVRNTGSIDATIESVWVRPNTAGSTWYKDADATVTVQVGKAGDVTAIPSMGNFNSSGSQYVLRMACDYDDGLLLRVH